MIELVRNTKEVEIKAPIHYGLDDSLTKAGYAADAKAVGDAIANIEISGGGGGTAETEIYYAEYGVTKIADLRSAYTEGKYIVCKNGEYIAPLVKITISTTNPNNPTISTFTFATMAGGAHYFYSINIRNLWGTAEKSIPTKTSELQNDNNYTTAEAVRIMTNLQNYYTKQEVDNKLDIAVEEMAEVLGGGIDG